MPPVYDNVGWSGGLIQLVAYGLSFFYRILDYIFSATGTIEWGVQGDGQIFLSDATIPGLTAKGEDIVGALMTIIHNGIVMAAEFTTLLPVNVG